MNPMIEDTLMSTVRHLLTLAGGVLVANGYLDDGQVTLYAAGGATFLVGLALSVWQKYAARRKLVTALASSTQTTEQAIETSILVGVAASVTTPKDVVPVIGAS